MAPAAVDGFGFFTYGIKGHINICMAFYTCQIFMCGTFNLGNINKRKCAWFPFQIAVQFPVFMALHAVTVIKTLTEKIMLKFMRNVTIGTYRRRTQSAFHFPDFHRILMYLLYF